MLRSNVSFPNQRSAKSSIFALFAALCAVLLFSGVAQSTSAEPVLLSIRGNIADAENSVIELNLKTIVSMEPTTVTTSAPWTDGPTQYTGVRINKLLDYVGAKSNQFEALAINDYKFTLSNIDFDKYPIIIAYQKNGELLDVRKLGPLMIVFPFDDYPELLTERNKAASVWQLVEMLVL